MMTFLYYLGGLIKTASGWVVGVFVALAAAYWGSTPDALRVVLQAVALCTVADTCLGVIAAFACPGKKFSSHHFSRVVYKMAVYLFTLLMAFGVDLVAKHFIGSQAIFQLIVGTTIIFREAMSAVEYSAVLGVKWPKSFTDKLDLARKQIENCFDEALTVDNQTKPKE